MDSAASEEITKAEESNTSDEDATLNLDSAMSEENTGNNHFYYDPWKHYIRVFIGVVIIIAVVYGFIFRGTPVESISLEYENASLDLDSVGSIDVTIEPEDATNKEIKWSSSDETVATVEEDGTINPLKEGETTIIAESNNGKKASCNLTVQKPGPDFKYIYSEYLDSKYSEVGNDGTYLKIDTNPKDLKDYEDGDALKGFFEVIRLLDLPSSFVERVGATRAIDGMQSEEFDEVKISWTFHPSQGLEILFATE